MTAPSLVTVEVRADGYTVTGADPLDVARITTCLRASGARVSELVEGPAPNRSKGIADMAEDAFPNDPETRVNVRAKAVDMAIRVHAEIPLEGGDPGHADLVVATARKIAAFILEGGDA